jgi:hemerythrin-like domain-containing protein
MHEAVRIIEDEHRSLAAVLDGLRHVTRDALSDAVKPDFDVLRAMLDYIVAFPEKLHHPKEDRYLFSAIRACSLEAGPLLDELKAEHARGHELIRELQQALLAYEKGGSGEARAFRRTVEEYADFHWMHMRREEDLVLPLAERVLSEADWRAIAVAFKENDDPLFGIKPKEVLTGLFRRILMLTPPPIGIGPEAAPDRSPRMTPSTLFEADGSRPRERYAT